METSSSDATSLEPSSPLTRNAAGQSSRTLQFPNLRLLQNPIQTLIEASGIFNLTRPDYSHHEARPLANEASTRGLNSDGEAVGGGGDVENGAGSINDGEVSIRIVGGGNGGGGGEDGVGIGMGVEEGEVGGESGDSNGGSGNGENAGGATSSGRYDVQQAARWVEQIFPFALLLLVVFIRQHLQGFFVAIYVTAILFKSNDILRKQTALKGERRISVLLGYSILFMLQVFGIYWWDRKEDLFYPMVMIPPKAVPPFWHAMFIILVNDTMVRQAAMVLKLVILMYYKNGRGHNFRRQGQMLTLVEYTVLLYRALLPAPVWYRFFLNKEYGSLFSSLTTGLYLTFKLTSIVEKVKSFYTALKALSGKEVHYGSYATSEQVSAAGDLCAICQEKMHTPILLRCKHIFCEDCVSEWFDRERTCPLCRALVRPADLRSYGDGSTSLFFQLF